MVDIPVPPVMEEIVAVVQEEEKLVPQERVQQRSVEHVPMPQNSGRDGPGGLQVEPRRPRR